MSVEPGHHQHPFLATCHFQSGLVGGDDRDDGDENDEENDDEMTKGERFGREWRAITSTPFLRTGIPARTLSQGGKTKLNVLLISSPLFDDVISSSLFDDMIFLPFFDDMISSPLFDDMIFFALF